MLHKQPLVKREDLGWPCMKPHVIVFKLQVQRQGRVCGVVLFRNEGNDRVGGPYSKEESLSSSACHLSSRGNSD